MGDTEELAESVSSLQAAFEAHRYICSEEIATAVFSLPAAQTDTDRRPRALVKPSWRRPPPKCSTCR